MNDRDWLMVLREKTIRPGMRVLDVGANEGLYTSTLVAGGAEVWAIEPSLESAMTIRVTCPKAHVLEYVIGADNGRTTFWHSHKDSKQHSCYRQALPQPQAAVEMTVPMRTLDDLMATGELPATFDFVKMDTQGAEGAILSQASRLLASEAGWMVELWPYGLQCAGWTVDQVIARLEAGTPYNLHHRGVIAWTWDQVRRTAAKLASASALNLGVAKPGTPIGEIWAALAHEKVA